MELQGCLRFLAVLDSNPTSSDHVDLREARRITTRDSCFQGLASPPHTPMAYLARCHLSHSSCWLPLHFYILSRKKKGSVEVQPSLISPGEGKYRLFWQRESGSLNKQQTGSVSLELARLGTRQTTRTEGQPSGSASRASSPGPGFHKRTQTSFVGPCQVHLFSKHPGFLHLIYYEMHLRSHLY